MKKLLLILVSVITLGLFTGCSQKETTFQYTTIYTGYSTLETKPYSLGDTVYTYDDTNYIVTGTIDTIEVSQSGITFQVYVNSECRSISTYPCHDSTFQYLVLRKKDEISFDKEILKKILIDKLDS